MTDASWLSHEDMTEILRREFQRGKAPGTGHTMTIDFDAPGLSFTCNEPPEAFCHAVWECECETWERHGVDEYGPWHISSGHADVHRAEPSAECAHILFMEVGDAFPSFESVGGSVTVPIDFTWEGDCYSWRIVPAASR